MLDACRRHATAVAMDVACFQHADLVLVGMPHTALRFVWGY